MANLVQIILECVDGQLEQMSPGVGSVRPGHNGPYNDPETPVRNTGHWLITFSRAFEWTGEEKYRDAARRCAQYLCSKTARPHGFSFHHRKGRKDHCNGLIGQAWTFEALAEAGQLLNDSKYARLAEEVFFQHPFDEETGLWNRLEIDGRILPLDGTFNHQLWFAVCSAMINANRRDEILQRVKRFMDCLDMNVTILSNGLLYHPIEHLFEEKLARQFLFKKRAETQVNNLLRALKHFQFPKILESEKVIRKRFRENHLYKSIGYHAFNIYAYALLKRQMPDHPFWSSDSFLKLIGYMETDEYLDGIDNNKFGYPYNPPGFEVPFCLFIFKDLKRTELIEQTRYWVGEQFRRCINPQTGKIERNTEDPETNTARLYELTRLPWEILEAVEIELSIIPF